MRVLLTIVFFCLILIYVAFLQAFSLSFTCIGSLQTKPSYMSIEVMGDGSDVLLPPFYMNSTSHGATYAPLSILIVHGWNVFGGLKICYNLKFIYILLYYCYFP
jgi:hypothetical protein